MISFLTVLKETICTVLAHGLRAIPTFNDFYYYRQHYREDGLPKVDYKSEERALKSASAMTRKQAKTFDAYECKVCRGWHIGKRPF